MVWSRIGAALAGHDSLPILIQLLSFPFHAGNAANGWMGRFGRFLPMPSDGLGHRRAERLLPGAFDVSTACPFFLPGCARRCFGQSS